jgi:predicted RNA polymerase sigma factor
VHAVRAHLLLAQGRREEAAAEFRTAAKLTLSTPERRYLIQRAASAASGPPEIVTRREP